MAEKKRRQLTEEEMRRGRLAAKAVAAKKELLYKEFKGESERVEAWKPEPEAGEVVSSAQAGILLRDLRLAPKTAQTAHDALWSVAQGVWDATDKQIKALRLLVDGYKTGHMAQVQRDSAAIIGNAIESLSNALAAHVTDCESVTSGDQPEPKLLNECSSKEE